MANFDIAKKWNLAPQKIREIDLFDFTSFSADDNVIFYKYFSANSGRGYDQEDDPDFVAEVEEESSESSEESDVDDVVDDDDELGAEGDKVKDLANMVEDMTIPDEAEDQDAKIDEEEGEGDDSVDVAEEIEMSVVQELA